MSISNIVNVQISRRTAGVSRAGFGIPFILTPEADFEEIRTYSSVAASSDDFATSTQTNKLLAAIFGQTPHPRQVKVGKARAKVAQVQTITPDVSVQEVTTYRVTINGVDFEFTSDDTPSAAEVVAGLIAEINGGDEPVTASGTTSLVVTSDDAGRPFICSVGDKLTSVLTTPSAGIADDILAAVQADTGWYALLTTDVDLTTIQVAAQTIESLRRMYFVRSSADGIKQSGTSDIASWIKDNNLFRTAIWFTGTPVNGLDAAHCGRFLPTDPGTEVWANKNLALQVADKLTDSEIAFIEGKNANYYSVYGGIAIGRQGKVGGGEWIDIIRNIDEIQARMEEDCLQAMIDVDKIPFTDGGIGIYETVMRKELQRQVRKGAVASFEIEVPLAAEISSTDKASRRLTGLNFSAVMAGAIIAVDINGNVSL